MKCVNCGYEDHWQKLFNKIEMEERYSIYPKYWWNKK